ncbi:MAG: ribonuclease P protein component [Oscillospiraceae bacterium]|nr:ribonuclease P protein component [Oscillospiraceae bacterium]
MLYTEILNNNRNFLTLYKQGKCIVSRFIVIYFKKNNLPCNRFGITVGKKSLKSAVSRNRAKRIIRQAYRENEINMPIGIDIVIVAKSLICSVTSDEISRYLKKYGIPEINSILSGKN